MAQLVVFRQELTHPGPGQRPSQDRLHERADPAPNLGAERLSQTPEVPPQKERCTNATVRSTLGLSWGDRTRAGSTTNPRACAYPKSAWFNVGLHASAVVTMVITLSGFTTLNTPPQNPHNASNPHTASNPVAKNPKSGPIQLPGDTQPFGESGR